MSGTGLRKLPTSEGPRRLPSWIKTRIPGGERYAHLKGLLRERGLATVCEEAHCPNIAECWGGGTATVMLLGETCTRGCRFCAVDTHKTPPPADPNEPEKLATLVAELGLTYIVLTMVDRDDMPDGGADHVARAIAGLRVKAPELLVEALVGDFQGDRAAIETVVRSGLHVFAHNLEVVERLTPEVRDARCSYRQSLEVLRLAKELRPEVLTKSSIMLGLGETEDELIAAMRDLRAAGVSILTLGQYLRPSSWHLPVHSFIEPARFDALGDVARGLGFEYVASGPLVRSSYRAGELFIEKRLRHK